MIMRICPQPVDFIGGVFLWNPSSHRTAMTRTETETAAPEVVQDARGAAEPQQAVVAVDAKVDQEAPVAGRDAADEALYAGLFPEDCTKTALEMVLLANPELEDKGVCVDAFATEAFVNATELQRTAVRFRMAAGASAVDARASVAKSQGIDLARLFGVPAEAKAIAEVLFKQEDRKRKEPEA